MLRNLLLLLLLIALVGCGSESADPTWQLRLQGASGQPLTSYVALLTGGGQVVRLECPGARSATFGAQCVAGGLTLRKPPTALHILVKSKGWQSRELSATPSAGSTQPLVLFALPDPVQSADYATVLTPAAGADAFAALAYAASTELGQTQSVKFLVTGLDTAEPSVFLQNTKTHPLHYTFAHDVLHLAGTVGQFEQATYHGQDRKQAAGTLVRFVSVADAKLDGGAAAKSPVALTFFSSDDLQPALVARLHRLVEDRLGFVPLTGGSDRLAYLPAGDGQEVAAAEQRTLLVQSDVPWLDRKSLYGGLKLQVMNPGVSYGTLRRLTPEELPSAIVSSRDILLLTRLPNALPIVGGTIVEELQTPLAHVNVAAHARGLPNISLLDASTDPRVQPLLGKLVRFEVKDGDFSLTAVTLAEAQAWWGQKQKPPFVPQHDDDFTDLADLSKVGFSDWTRIGVKAANVAELSHFIGEHAPHGFAVPFHWYVDFVQKHVVTSNLCTSGLSQCVASGRAGAACDKAKAFCDIPAAASMTLADFAARLSGDSQLQADSPALEATLFNLQYMFTQLPLDPTLAAAIDGAVAQQFGSGKVRLRSSTNSEDLPGFSGAGLYDSTGATATGKSSASLMIRSIWASVWSWRAFEERAWWNIDHQHVRMGVLVHQSFPDEQAGGVLITQNIADPTTYGVYVNVQLGEMSVTNPTNGAVAEVFSMVAGPNGMGIQRLRWSSLSPGQPLLSDAETIALYKLASQVQAHFAPLYQQDAGVMALDIEFKFHGPERALFFKQVRPYVNSY